jgi:hypothetical protein
MSKVSISDSSILNIDILNTIDNQIDKIDNINIL